MRRTVVFPGPVRPEQAEHLPRSTVNETPFTALNPPW